jgi:hypothetical protein
MIIFDHLIKTEEIIGIGPLDINEVGEGIRLSFYLYLHGQITFIQSPFFLYAEEGAKEASEEWKTQYNVYRTMVLKVIREEEKYYDRHCRQVNEVYQSLCTEMDLLLSHQVAPHRYAGPEDANNQLAKVRNLISELKILAVK